MKQIILVFVISFVVIAQSATTTDLRRVKRQFNGPGFNPFLQPGGFPQQGPGQVPFGGFPGGFAFPGEFNPSQGQGNPPQPQGQFNQQPQGQFNQQRPNQFNQQQPQGQFNPQNPNQQQPNQFNPQQPQGQFNQQQPNQRQPQGQFNQQQPNQQQLTTPATTVSPQVQACSEGCGQRIVSTYNPVCGSDGQTYQNRELFECNVECGRRITLVQVGGCPGRNATTNRPTK